MASRRSLRCCRPLRVDWYKCFNVVVVIFLNLVGEERSRNGVCCWLVLVGRSDKHQSLLFFFVELTNGGGSTVGSPVSLLAKRRRNEEGRRIGEGRGWQWGFVRAEKERREEARGSLTGGGGWSSVV